MSQQSISIIGAGLGGLTLARCLHREGISTVIYERLSSPARHAYGITLHPSTSRPFLQALALDEQVFRHRVAVDGMARGISLDNHSDSNAMEPTAFRAHRGKLEQLLREDLDIRWGRSLEKLELSLPGTTLRFQDGEKFESNLVICADGPHSNSRKSLSLNTSSAILPLVAFNGKRQIERVIFEDVYAPSMEGSNIIEMQRNGTAMNVSITGYEEDLVDISWVYSRPPRGQKDLLYKPDRPVSGAKDIPEAFFQEAGALGDLPQPFEDIFDHRNLRQDRVLHWLMRTILVDLDELQSLSEKGISFLGDAIHAQPIIGGQGANEAIKDAVELAEVISKYGKEHISTWYAGRYPAWKEGIRISERVIAKMHDGHDDV